MSTAISVNDDLVVYYGDKHAMTYDAKVNWTEIIIFSIKCIIIILFNSTNNFEDQIYF